jgi:hypothetical protein
VRASDWHWLKHQLQKLEVMARRHGELLDAMGDTLTQVRRHFMARAEADRLLEGLRIVKGGDDDEQ